MKAVFYGVGAFLLISLWLFVLAFQLIPTDIGNTYLLGGYLFVVGAGLLAGMAFVGKAIIQEIKGLQAMPAPRVIETEPVVTLPQIPISTLPAEEKPKVGTGAILATSAAAATAGVVAGGLLGGVTRAEASPTESLPKVEDKFLDDLERDLFADIGKTEPKLFPDRVEESDVTRTETETETEDAALLAPPGEALADTGEGETAEDEDAAIEDEAPAPVSTDIAAPAENEPEADDDDTADEDREDLAVEEDAPPTSTPGLIADDDLAALQDDEPALVPLETLDIVGAYDSGGTRFTMYSDGSVTALGEGVDRRFPSLDALRAFIDGGMKS
ncbi:MAG: hypothetical protein J0L51_01215 [Rhizobiales bacterium]|nr:hypothetical protein [Hyphomicrobiales bacterium]